jgi:hypothetical protein
VDTTPEELQSAIDVTLQRFTEYHNLQGAFGRRAVIEQAKGILMALHSIDADKAFGMLREHSQHNGDKLVDVAGAIVASHLLLVPAPQPDSAAPQTIQRREVTSREPSAGGDGHPAERGRRAHNRREGRALMPSGHHFAPSRKSRRRAQGAKPRGRCRRVKSRFFITQS